MFQLNDYYLWTEFKNDYWFENIELNPFNWKHNTYIARSKDMKNIVIQIKGQIEDDVSINEVENAIYDELPIDFESVIVEEQE